MGTPITFVAHICLPNPVECVVCHGDGTGTKPFNVSLTATIRATSLVRARELAERSYRGIGTFTVREQITVHYWGDLECLCGNHPNAQGFSPSGPDGADIEPTVLGPWQGHYRCDQCGRVVEGQTGVVLRQVEILGYDEVSGRAKVERRQLADRRAHEYTFVVDGMERRHGQRRGRV